MIITMHELATMHSNIKTDIRIASETGYDAMEIFEPKLLRYLDCGFKPKDLLSLFEKYNIKPVCINALKGVERVEPKELKELMMEAERLCDIARIIKCPIVQLVAYYSRPEEKSWEEILKITAKNVADIADIGKKNGVRFQLEPIAWSPINSLSKAIQVIEKVEKENVGLVIDFWHLWAGGETTADEVSKLNGSMIYGVHFCDGIKNTPGKEWNELELRSFLPGEGDIDINEWVEAVKATGFDGVWSAELLSPKHWEWDLLEIARETKVRMEKYICK